MILDVRNLSFSYDEEILEDISFSIEGPQVLGLLGRNGVGKSTLFKILLGILKAETGRIYLKGKDLKSYRPRDLARVMAYIPQSHNPVYNYSVLDVVSMGFAGHLGLFSSPGRAQRQKAMDILGDCGIGDLAGRGYQNISGGQRQLVLIARALVQEAEIILMDEPVANLDFANQDLVLRTLRDLAKKGLSIIVSMHNPSQALRYTDSVLVLNDKKLLVHGPTAGVLTEEVLEKAYGMDICLYPIDHCGEKIKIALAKN